MKKSNLLLIGISLAAVLMELPYRFTPTAGETRYDALYVIERGSVELRVPDPGTGEERVLSVFEKGSYVDEGYAGDFFGEFSLVGLEPWNATVTARERTALLQLKRDELYELFSRDIDLQIGMILNIARVLSRRLRLRNRQG